MAIIETLSAISSVSAIWEKISAFRCTLINRDGILVAYRYELMSNYNLLKDVNFDALSDTKISSPEFRNLILCLQTQVASSILYDSNRENYKVFMDAIERIGIKIPLEEAKEETEENIDTLIKAMRFTVNKIEHLKRLVICASEGSALFNNLRLKVRVNNIFNSLKEISIALPKGD